MMNIMKTMQSFIAKGSLIVLSLVVLGGCDLFKKKETKEESNVSQSAEGGTVLCTIDGQAAVKEAEFLDNLNQMIQANPYFKGATVDSLPKDLLRKFFDQLATQALIVKYADKNHIEKDPEYIKAFNKTKEQLENMLKVQIFEKKIYDNIKIDEADIKKYYEENKDRFVKAAGGVLLVSARFDTEVAADAFLDSVKNKVADFEKLAKADPKAKFKEFGRVSKEVRGMQQEMIPSPVKEAALSMMSIPGVEKVKAGKEFWVIKVSDKQEAALFDLDEVKSHVEAILKNNKYRDVLEKRIKELKDEFKIVINEDYFKEKTASEENKEDADIQALGDVQSSTSAAA